MSTYYPPRPEWSCLCCPWEGSSEDMIQTDNGKRCPKCKGVCYR